MVKGPARGKKDGRAGGYVESWQGVRRRAEGRGIGLKSRINLKIGSKNGLRGLAGFGLMEARYIGTAWAGNQPPATVKV